jgi:signal transduction histidine kinase/CheY-like chemotaxis protein
MRLPLLSIDLRYEQDVVKTRQRARELADALNFDYQDQIRIATAVSEIARNAIEYGKGGRVEFSVFVEGGSKESFVVEVKDKGPGISNLDRIMTGQFTSSTGMGLGIVGARRLMDLFDVDSTPGKGTNVVLTKHLPKRVAPLDRKKLQDTVDAIARGGMNEPLQELEHQNRELLSTLQQLNARQSELLQLNKELEETNRGVVALYAEINDKADYLQRASELKSKFLSNMSHEFRTPLNSVLALSRILLDRLDGDLTREQEKQVQYIRRSAEQLIDMVNDLLDIAKVEAGKITVRPVEFDAAALFGSLRGVLKPLLVSQRVNLVFDEPQDVPALHTDDSKVAQILRNFISNALKFTERGEVRVSVSVLDSEHVQFSVQDTGIGIAEHEQERIFEEFSQVENPLQKNAKGTGLGLPLSRKLANLLGGAVTVQSTLGVGSIFSLIIPRRYRELVEDKPARIASAEPTILVIDDDEVSRYLLRNLLHGTNFRISEASNGSEGLKTAQAILPVVVFLDLNMPDMSGFEVLERLKNEPKTADIPVIVYTSKVLDEKEVATLNRAAAILPKNLASRDEQLQIVSSVFKRAGLTIEVQNATV